MTDSGAPHVVVVGAGLSGLSAAFYLRQKIPGVRVSVVEASPKIGGVIQTETIDGFLVEHGADMFATEPGDALQLCRDLGVEDQLMVPEESGRGAMIVRGGRLLAVPEGFVLMRATRVWPMLTTPLLSVAAKLRLARERFVPPRDSDEDESVAAFTRRRLGNEVLQRIVQPLVGGIYTADPERLSMLATMRQFVSMEREHGSLSVATRARRQAGTDSRERSSSGARYSQFRGFPGGMTQWFEALAAALPAGSLHTNTKVESLQRVADRWRLQTSGDASIDDADAVVLATPARVAAKLCQPFADASAALLSGMEAASSAILVLGVRNEDIARRPSTFGFVVPACEGHSILACSFASHKFPGRAPEGHTLLRVFMGGAMQPELCDLEDQELHALAGRDLEKLIGWNGRAVMQRVVRWNQAMPQYHVGHLDRIAEIEAGLDAFPTLALAGNSLHGVGIAPVVRTAKRGAEKIAEALVDGGRA
ncbi:protoporphyrinogen oxidase [Roseimaritima ulvae]|uniref:protoporphyrinogen oxidase n=1 Tax=Roseimaritima ulvae TaxID=980254 RepID=UPI000833FCBF|nr:protoporphyrinogen oxidase [Roseimaritima ulvae]